MKYFNADLGFGLIEPDDGGKAVLVHSSALKRAGIHVLTEGVRLRFKLITCLGRQVATQLEMHR